MRFNHCKQVLPVVRGGGGGDNKDANTILSNGLNLRAMLGAYMLDMGGIDIAKLIGFVSIPGGIGFETAFYRVQKEVNERIIERCKQIVQQALLTEIAVILRETVGEKLDKQLV